MESSSQILYSPRSSQHSTHRLLVDDSRPSLSATILIGIYVRCVLCCVCFVLNCVFIQGRHDIKYWFVFAQFFFAVYILYRGDLLYINIPVHATPQLLFFLSAQNSIAFFCFQRDINYAPFVFFLSHFVHFITHTHHI